MEEVCKSQTRVIIRVCVSDIPGEIGRRPNTLGQKFCSQILHRDFKKEIELSGFDSIHIPPGFDSTEPVSRWFVYDLNVKGELDKDAVKAIPHFVYFASLVNEKWIFTPKEKYVDRVKAISSSCFWGGRTEQEIAGKLRASLEEATGQLFPISDTIDISE